jgi:hypothetical protein
LIGKGEKLPDGFIYKEVEFISCRSAPKKPEAVLKITLEKKDDKKI